MKQVCVVNVATIGVPGFHLLETYLISRLTLDHSGSGFIVYVSLLRVIASLSSAFPVPMLLLLEKLKCPKKIFVKSQMQM